MSDFFVDEKNPHLGGFKTGPVGDEATYFPELWLWLVNDIKVESVIDIGCGSGVAVNFFETLLPGSVIGVDGIPQNQSNIYQHDFTKSKFVPPKPFKGRATRFQYNLCWCCETLEHIEEKFLPNVLAAFKCAKMVLVTHADPGQQGFHHVNCRTSEYWRGCMAAIGYRPDALLTAQARAKAAFNQSPYNHFVRSGMAFVRN